ncbi:S-adenosyl-L-methionine-dependent methyltransferase [Staphylotrichum tortipilum]|uniref:S-adenosyl-L-methionine-dependent methyltransferase n=1 Tax=Staphylotrichum tortipilum TaxID=2831512 RepID=A0AAN6MMM9_9PEZI|nr:S-adenosyl-L-methionine-dependent methyltransferase [Staphylotrichum longicolle]
MVTRSVCFLLLTVTLLMAYRTKNGRTYHDPSRYPWPNDKQEQQRQVMLHEQCLISNDGQLVCCPQERYQRVLDIGTGTGIWAMEFADKHPGATVIGVDLSPIQPQWVPLNCNFEIDNVELEWTWSGDFDFIHGRMLGGCFEDPASIFNKSFEKLKRGSYLEVADVLLIPKCDDGTLRPDSQLLRWAGLLAKAADKMGRPINPASRYEQMLAKAGFEDIKVIEAKWPSNRWAKDQKLRVLGYLNSKTLQEELEAISMALLTRGLGWGSFEVNVLCAYVRRELMNPNIHVYFPFITAYGKKP